MEFSALLSIYAIFLLLVSDMGLAARGGGRRGGSRKQGSRGSSRMQIYIPRNQDGASYYDNANVGIMNILFILFFDLMGFFSTLYFHITGSAYHQVLSF